MKTRALRFSAGLVVVHLGSGSDPLYLLLRAYNYWDFPKGTVEGGESPLEAAHREALEETGLSKIDLRWGESFVETEVYSRNKIARYYVGHSASLDVKLGINPLLGRAEHHAFEWCAARAAHERLVPRVQKVLEWARGIVEGSR